MISGVGRCFWDRGADERGRVAADSVSARSANFLWFNGSRVYRVYCEIALILIELH